MPQQAAAACNICGQPRSAALTVFPNPSTCTSARPLAVHWGHAGPIPHSTPAGLGICQPPQRAAAAGRARSNLYFAGHPCVGRRAHRPGGRAGRPVAGAAGGGGGPRLHLRMLLPGSTAPPLVSAAGARRGAAHAAVKSCGGMPGVVAHVLHAPPCCRDRYWSGEDDGREPLLLQRQRGEPAGPQADSPHAAGYRTPPSRFHSPFTSPGKPPVSYPVSAGPLTGMSSRPAACGSPTAV